MTETKRSKRSRRASTRTRGRSSRCMMASTNWYSVSSSIWNSSSRGVMLQHGGERLARMAVGIEAGAAHQVVDLAPQIRDRARRARVDRRGEQADDAEFADQVAIAIEPLHADVIHVHAPVHARVHVRLGDDELLRLLQELHDLGRDRDQLAAAAQHMHVGRSQDAEPALGNDLVAALVAGQRVFAHAEEGEVVGDQPFEELRRLGDFLDRQRRRIVLDLGDDLADARHHRPPVLHAEAHVGEHAADRLDDLVLPRLVLDALDVDVDEALAPRGADRRAVAAEADQRAGLVALDREDRMQHEPHIDALLGELGHHRVEQERHVVVDHLDDRDGPDALRAHRAGARLEADLRARPACAPAETARRLRQARQARAPRSAPDPRPARRRTSAARKLSGTSPRTLLMMICACSINRRTARSSSLTNCPWIFMGVSPARFAEFSDSDSP